MSRTFPAHVITDDSALGGSVIQRSLRFNVGDNTYLSRTPSSAGNRRTWTISFWFKTEGGGSLQGQRFWSVNSSLTDGAYASLAYENDGFIAELRSHLDLRTTAVFRDPTAWYHVVLALDTTQSTSSDRAKLYVNGTQITAFNTESYPSQNHEGGWNSTSEHNIGRELYLTRRYFGGYMAEFTNIDGQQLTPSYFGYTESQTGLWRPKRYEGTYGTNGFHLDFSDNSSTTTLGIDKSPNGNDWSVNNFSVSAGAGNDSLEDTPTNNFCTLNPLDKMGTVTVSNGNLKAVINGDNASLITGSLGVSSGKWYYEAVADTAGAGFVGWIRLDVSSYTGYPYQQTGSLIYFSQNGSLYLNGAGGQSYGTSYGNGDVIGCAIDLDNNKVTFYKNNSSQGTVSITAGTYHPNTCTGGSGATFTFNFGQRPFSYTPPTGHKTINSKNLPPNVPSIIRPQKHFETLIYTGNGSTRTISGLEFTPDFLWIKNRSSAFAHALFDSVRGPFKRLRSDSSNAEDGNDSDSVSGFVSGGFTTGADDAVNQNSSNIVAWCWKAGGTAVTNTDGTINTQVSVNEEAGFSIATYTGNGATTATIGHGLGKTPAWIIIKNRSSSTDWVVMHEGIGSYDGGNYKHQPIKLNSTDAKTSILGIWQTPNSSTQQISDGQTSGSNRPLTNTSGDNYVAYFWAEIPGYSKFGKYTGNGSSDGTYIHLGFRPAWIIIRNRDAGGFNWVLQDNKRSPFNLCDNKLNPDASAVEQTDADKIDMLSNGFKCRTGDAGINANNSVYIYMAFAEQPGTTAFETFPNAR